MLGSTRVDRGFKLHTADSMLTRSTRSSAVHLRACRVSSKFRRTVSALGPVYLEGPPDPLGLPPSSRCVQMFVEMTWSRLEADRKRPPSTFSGSNRPKNAG
jgi:hypothetical protein